MPIHSMTGFARQNGEGDHIDWEWEVRTVNHRGRDIRFRLPAGGAFLDTQMRAMIPEFIHRGSCQIVLNVNQHEEDENFILNKSALKSLRKVVEEAREILGGGEVSIDRILQTRGVLETVGEDQVAIRLKAERTNLLESFRNCLKEVARMRLQEGQALKVILGDYLDQMRLATERAEMSPSRSQAFIRERIRQQVERLVGSSDQLEPDRLHQEAVLIAVRADIEEEITRLKTHIEAAHVLLNRQTGPVGRELDFLTQELSREANTLCSKSQAADVTEAGLALKTLIDQFKEQIQNIE